MAEMLTLDGIIEDLQAVAPLLLQFEKKYKMLSPFFYKLYHYCPVKIVKLVCKLLRT